MQQVKSQSGTNRLYCPDAFTQYQDKIIIVTQYWIIIIINYFTKTFNADVVMTSITTWCS